MWLPHPPIEYSAAEAAYGAPLDLEGEESALLHPPPACATGDSMYTEAASRILPSALLLELVSQTRRHQSPS